MGKWEVYTSTCTHFALRCLSRALVKKKMNAGDADAHSAAGFRHQLGQQLLGKPPVSRATRFDQREGPGKRADIAGANAGHVGLKVQFAASGRRSRQSSVHGSGVGEQFLGAIRRVREPTR